MRAWIWLVLLAPVVALAGVYKHVDHKHWANKYDHHFRKYAKRYFGPNLNWRWFKAQGIAESGLNPKAHSKAGAIGIMQIMPATFKDIKKKNPAFLDLHDPHWNIAAGIYYDRLLFDKWDFLNTRTTDQLFFAFGSYNAGYARIRRVYNRLRRNAKAMTTWTEMEKQVPAATRHYVKRIRKLVRGKI